MEKLWLITSTLTNYIIHLTTLKPKLGYRRGRNTEASSLTSQHTQKEEDPAEKAKLKKEFWGIHLSLRWLDLWTFILWYLTSVNLSFFPTCRWSLFYDPFVVLFHNAVTTFLLHIRKQMKNRILVFSAINEHRLSKTMKNIYLYSFNYNCNAFFSKKQKKYIIIIIIIIITTVIHMEVSRQRTHINAWFIYLANFLFVLFIEFFFHSI